VDDIVNIVAIIKTAEIEQVTLHGIYTYLRFFCVRFFELGTKFLLFSRARKSRICFSAFLRVAHFANIFLVFLL